MVEITASSLHMTQTVFIYHAFWYILCIQHAVNI